jgi:hypothetical protein
LHKRHHQLNHFQRYRQLAGFRHHPRVGRNGFGKRISQTRQQFGALGRHQAFRIGILQHGHGVVVLG